MRRYFWLRRTTLNMNVYPHAFHPSRIPPCGAAGSEFGTVSTKSSLSLSQKSNHRSRYASRRATSA